MKTVDLISLHTCDFHLGDVFAMRQRWRHRGFFLKPTPRRNGCLLWYCGCSGRYQTEGKTFVAPRGSVVYIPEGSVYKTDFFDFGEGEVDTVLVEFTLLLPDGEHFNAADRITILQREPDALMRSLFDRLVEEQAAATVSLAAMKASIYQLLDHLCRTGRRQAMFSPHFQAIAKGISYLECDPRQEKSIKELAEMCFVSTAYFRRLFKEYAGVTPVDYRIRSRMEYAKKLLRLGTMSTQEVAQEVGFDDPAYFCRIFKKRCGLSPGQYRAGAGVEADLGVSTSHL